MNQQTLEGHWSEIKGKVSEKWGQLTEDDLMKVRGSAEQLVGLIQQKTGETREAVSEYLDSLTAEDGPLSRTLETAQGYATAASETAQETAQQAMDQARAGYIQTERMIRKKPMESLAVCLGVGIVTGIVGGLLLRSR